MMAYSDRDRKEYRWEVRQKMLDLLREKQPMEGAAAVEELAEVASVPRSQAEQVLMHLMAMGVIIIGDGLRLEIAETGEEFFEMKRREATKSPA